MQLFLSTTFHGTTVTDVDEVLRLLDGLDIDGIELGSTHIHRSDLGNVIKENCKRNIVTHNFFPPAKRKDLVMNIASINSEVRNQSVNHARYCIKFAAEIGASVYTVHPGFLATPDVNKKNSHTYDFNFTEERVNKEIAFANMVDSLFLLIETAIDNKITLAIETEGSLTEPGVLLMERIEEYNELFTRFSDDIYINLNLAHTRFASIEHRYKMEDFIKQYYDKIVLVEVSHNNGKIDQHLPLTDDSYLFDYLSLLPIVPHILEFRNATLDQIKNSITLMRNFSKNNQGHK
jgi:sugar phosphate isomerase/epimerase